MFFYIITLQNHCGLSSECTRELRVHRTISIRCFEAFRMLCMYDEKCLINLLLGQVGVFWDLVRRYDGFCMLSPGRISHVFLFSLVLFCGWNKIPVPISKVSKCMYANSLVSGRPVVRHLLSTEATRNQSLCDLGQCVWVCRCVEYLTEQKRVCMYAQACTYILPQYLLLEYN